MAEVHWPVSVPAGEGADVEVGAIVDDAGRVIVGVYGWNNTPDSVYFEVELDSGPQRNFRVTLPPFTPVREVRLPRGRQLPLREIVRTERRGIPLPVPQTTLILPVTRLITERVFANPTRRSPVVLSVTATEVTSGTTHNIAMPATVDAGDLLANVMTWNGDGDATTNGVPSGWAEDGEVNDAPFGYISLLVKDAVGDEDGTSVNFTTSPGAPVIGHVYRIEAGSWDDSDTAIAAVQIGGAANGESTAPNPGTLTPGWGSAANLWIAVANTTEDLTFSAVPSGYTDAGENQFAGADGELGLNTAYRTNEASSENPGAFTMQSGFWLAATIAVKPGAAAQQDLTGSLFQSAPTFNQGAVTAGAVNLAGTLFQKAPTFFAGTVGQALTGELFTNTPTFSTGSVTVGAVGVAGVLFQKAPTFPQGTVSSVYPLTGTLFQSSPTFFAGTVEVGAAVLTGSLFQNTPVFFVGSIIPETIELAGTLFRSTPTFPTGTFTSTYPLTGTLAVFTVTFPTGFIANRVPQQPGPSHLEVTTTRFGLLNVEED